MIFITRKKRITVFPFISYEILPARISLNYTSCPSVLWINNASLMRIK